MSDSIFREKSLKRISSPESLNDYVKVSNPGVWVLLLSVIFLLVGFFAWGIFGKIDSKISTFGVVSDGVLITYIKEDDIELIKESSLIDVDGNEYSIDLLDDNPSKIEQGISDLYLHIADMNNQTWIYRLSSNVQLEDGFYRVRVITERIKPISLLFN